VNSVFRGKDVRAELVLPAVVKFPDTVVVTCSNFRQPPDIDGEGFGQGFLFSQGVPALHVVTSANHWLQTPEFPDLIQALGAARAQFPRAIGYGSSMGGFGVSLMSGLLGFDGTLAISPQFSVQPHKIGNDRRWAYIPDQFLMINDDMEASFRREGNHHVIFDPETPDAIHAGLFAQLGATCHALPYSGHSSAGYLAQTGMLAPIALALVRDIEADIAGLCRDATMRCGMSPTYQANRALAMA
jgi:hypothetical protein